MAVKNIPVISKDMLIREIVSKYPETIEVFLNHNMHCIGCAVAHIETLAQGAEAHGIDIDKMVKDLNKAVEKKKQEKKKK